MSKIAIFFGAALAALGAWGYIGTGSKYPTALIPCYFGAALALCGILASSEDTKRRMLWMHIAVTIGLLGFLGTAKSIYDAARLFGGAQFPFPAAVEAKSAMSILCLAFVGLCVRSFIAARRARRLEA